MILEGRFILNPGPHEEVVENTIVQDGAERFLRSLFRGEAVLPSTYYVGLTLAAYTFTTATLALIAAGEPVGSGYARQAANRDTTDWTVEFINNAYRARTKTLVFGATSGYSYSRMFLCNASSGTTGQVFALSRNTPAPRAVISGQGPSLAYELWLRG